MKYRDNMTDAELSVLLAECERIDAIHTSAEALDAINSAAFPVGEEYFDEYADLRRAALNHEGRP